MGRAESPTHRHHQRLEYGVVRARAFSNIAGVTCGPEVMISDKVFRTPYCTSRTLSRYLVLSCTCSAAIGPADNSIMDCILRTTLSSCAERAVDREIFLSLAVLSGTFDVHVPYKTFFRPYLQCPRKSLLLHHNGRIELPRAQVL